MHTDAERHIDTHTKKTQTHTHIYTDRYTDKTLSQQLEDKHMYSEVPRPVDN